MKLLSDLLNDIKLLREKKRKEKKYLRDDWYMVNNRSGVSCGCEWSFEWSEQTATSLTARCMYDNIMTFNVKFWLWENQLELHNFLHFPHLKYPNPIYPERIQEYPKSILCFAKSSTNDSRISKLCSHLCCLFYLWRQILRRLQKVCK